MRSLIHWLHFSWECVPTNNGHCKTELDNGYYEYGVYVARGWSTHGVDLGIQIWKVSWRRTIHFTVLKWHLSWMGLIHPPYCLKVKWNPKRNNIPGRSIATFWRNLWQRCAFWKANEFLNRGGESNQRGNAGVKEAKLQRADPLRVMS